MISRDARDRKTGKRPSSSHLFSVVPFALSVSIETITDLLNAQLLIESIHVPIYLFLYVTVS